MNKKKTFKHEPTAVQKEIARRRLLDNKFTRKPKIVNECIPSLKVVHPNLVVPKKPFHKEEINLNKYSVKDAKNPFNVPIKDRLFEKCQIKRSNEPEELPPEEIRTVKDNIDKEFFSIVSGRPVRNFQDVKSYMENIRQIFFLKSEATHLREYVTKIDDIYGQDELKAYNEIWELYKNTNANFEFFVANSYEEMKKIVEQQAIIEEELRAVTIEYEKVNYEYFLVSNQLINLSDRFEPLDLYRGFLDLISPLYWRLEKRIGFRGVSVTYKSFFLSHDYDDNENDKRPSFTFTEKQVLPCDLFFQKPEELMEVFEGMEDYCFRQIQLEHYYTKKIELEPVAKKRDRLKENLLKFTHVNPFKYEMDKFEKDIRFFEEKENFYKEKFFRIINNEFNETLFSYDSLKLLMCVQFVHEMMFTDIQSDAKVLSVFVLMSQIEHKYMEYNLKLDELDYHIVNDTRNKLMKEDRDNMNKARFARRALGEYEMYKKSLQQSFEPPRYKYKNRIN